MADDVSDAAAASSPRPAPRLIEVWEGAGGPECIERVLITKRTDNRWQRFLAWLDMMVLDHGVLRVVRFNWGEVAPGMYRAAQPTPRQLRARIRRHGIKTVLNLRAERDCGAFVLEEQVCAEMGVTLVNVRVRSRDVPSKELIALLDRLYAEIERPALMHCKSGCDRTGIAAALYLILRENQPLEVALGQLSKRWGHIKEAKTGILDFFLERYGKDGGKTGLPFRTWVRDVYDPVTLKQTFMDRWNGRWFGVDLAFWRE